MRLFPYFIYLPWLLHFASQALKDRSVTGILIEQAIEDRWPLREAAGVDRSRQSRKLTVYHTLPLDATALLTLFPAEDLREAGSLWFGDQT